MTLIDNIFVSKALHQDFESAVILNDMLGHMPILTMLKQTKAMDKTNLEFKSRNLNDAKMDIIRGKLFAIDWIGELNHKTSSENFNKFCSIVNTIMDEVSPEKTIIISHKCKYVEPWMTWGIELALKKKLELYRKSISRNGSMEDVQKYRNEYNRLKCMVQKAYYARKVEEFRHKTKDLWKVINNIIGKNKHRGAIISHITVNGIKTYNPKVMANEFARFYSNLGANLATKIKPGSTTLQDYLNHIKRVDASLILKPILQLEVEDIIWKLPNKTSYGHDRISNLVLKCLLDCISFPLCSIFNQSIAEGKFPSAMKNAEVIPLYKGKEFDKVSNYRPVSLLIMIFKRSYMIASMALGQKRSCEQAILELIGRILDAKNKEMHSAAMFLDLSKAFDTLDHKILLKRLDLYGLRGVCNDWFRDY